MSVLDGKVAIVTGGAGGQGAAIASLFVASGAQVVVSDLDAEAGARLAGELGEAALFVGHDVTEASGWEDVVAGALRRFGRLDVLINNAGFYDPVGLVDTDDEQWERHYRVNQLGPFLGMRAVVGAMREAGGGSIVNNVSGVALGGVPGSFAYGASKWALRGMSKQAAVELAPFGIRVNGIFPGIIDTPMLEANGPERLAMFKQMIPMGRLGTPAEVAELMCFLASDAASYVTGAEVAIGGGLG